MKEKIKISMILAILVILAAGSVAVVSAAEQETEEVIQITLKQIENPNPEAMEAYTQLTGQPDEYLTRLYESLARLRGY